MENISDKALASKLFKDLEKSFSKKTCLASKTNACEGAIVSAHSISNKKFLNKIAVDGHVYSINRKKLFTPSPREDFITVERIGIANVSTFNGFCSKHDRELFLCLDNEDFIFSPKQCFTLAYRLVNREYYLNNEHPDLNINDIQKIHGDNKLEFTNSYDNHLAGANLRKETIVNLKKKFDNYIDNQTWSRLMTFAIIFDKKPNICMSSMYSPIHSMDGNVLIENENKMDDMFISILPISEDKGAAIFSWLDTSKSCLKLFFDSIIKSDDVVKSLIALSLSIENFAINPTWHEALTQDSKKAINKFINDNLLTVLTGEMLTKDTLPTDDWGNFKTHNF